VATENHAKATLRQRAMNELTEFAILTAYLYITLGAVILMKASVLHDHDIRLPHGVLPSSKPLCWRSSCCSAVQ
jgi:hypothetical protein